MRKKMVAIILLLIAISLLTIGIIQEQYTLINTFYKQMSRYS
ncbi:MAG: hypothetical protein ACTSQS_16120 [Promethearchaeota archaeon]